MSIADRLRSAILGPRLITAIDQRAPKSQPEYRTRGGRAGGVAYSETDPRPGARLLRNLSERSVWVRTAIKRRRNDVGRAKWAIYRTDDDKAKPDPKVVKAVTDLFRFVNDTGISFRSLIEGLVEDVLVLDAGCLELERFAGGTIAALWPVDGGSIKVDRAWDGSNPRAIRYRQYNNYKLQATFTNADLIYMMANPRTTSPIGFSPLEVLIKSVQADLYGETFEANALRRVAPPSIVNMKSATPAQVDETIDYWNSEVVGNGDDVAFIAGEINVIALNRSATEEDLRAYFTDLRKKIAAAFEMDPLVFNIHDGVQRSTGNNFQVKTDDGLMGLATVISEYLTLIVREFDDRHGFKFEDLTPRDALAQAKIDQIRMQIGATYPNEIRTRDGDDPFPGSEDPEHWANLPYNAAGSPTPDPEAATSGTPGSDGEDDPNPDDSGGGKRSARPFVAAPTTAGRTRSARQN